MMEQGLTIGRSVEFMNREQGDSAGAVSMSRLWSILTRRRAAIAAITLAAAAAAFCVNYFLLPKRYLSSASMLLTKDKTISTGVDLKAVGELLGAKSFESTDFNYRIVIESRALAERVFLSPDILAQYKKIPGFRNMEDGKIVDSQREFLELRIENNAIKLSFEGPTPELAAAVVNAYFKELDAFLKDSTRRKRGFLERELKRLQTLLDEKNREADLAVGPENKSRYTELMRDRVVLEQTYALTFSEYQKTIMDEHRGDKWFYMLDSGRAPEKKCHPKTVRNTLLFAALAFCASFWLFAAVELNRKA
jgi:uncharacterized protein involved in exopolysaccharide biosynthesis